MNTTVEGFRDFDALGTFTDLSDVQVAAELQAAEDLCSGLLGGRGYPADILATNQAYVRAVYKIARVDLLGIRGVNPTDPAHAMIIHERDRSVEWIEKVAKGDANLAGTGAPTRTTTGTAAAFGPTDEYGNPPEDRGW